MTRKVMIALGILVFYHAFAIFLLYSSSYLNVVSYYTHPPYKGEIQLRRLPLFFGDQIALEILRAKQDEATALVSEGDVGMAAILSSYQHNQALPEKEARSKSIQVAELFINAGYDMSRCETDGRSTAAVLQDWGMLDKEFQEFLTQKLGSEDMFSCHYRTQESRST